MLMGGNFKAAADPIIEVNAIDLPDSAFLSITS